MTNLREPAILVALLGLFACTAEISTDGASRPLCGAPGGAALHRLTPTEYDNTVRDLLGDDSKLATTFTDADTAEAIIGVPPVSPIVGEDYMNAAEQIAAHATQNMAGLVPCDPTKDGEEPCARQFIASFGPRAYRRPLDPAEVDDFVGVYQAGRQQGDFAAGIRTVIQTALQSPHFLYRVEVGTQVQDQPGVVRLNPFEVASRLSYLLWATLPDAPLVAAAQSGALATREQIATQARRMLADPRTHETVAHFHANWLQLDDIDTAEKDNTIFPAYTADLGKLMRTETEKFTDDVFWQSGGGLSQLLTARYTFLNKDLAAFYGIRGPSGANFEKVNLDGVQRGGLMTQAGFLTAQSDPDQTSPVLRGKFVRISVLCQPLTPPPANINTTPPDITPGMTTRERFAQHDKDPVCSPCHHLMDPIGLAFEKYDGIGRWRTTEAGKPIDDSGEVTESDVGGQIHGVEELQQKLAGSAQANRCLVTQWFRYAYRRLEMSQGDVCAIEKLKSALDDAHGDMRELLVALTQSDAFLFRSVATEAMP